MSPARSFSGATAEPEQRRQFRSSGRCVADDHILRVAPEIEETRMPKQRAGKAESDEVHGGWF